MATIRQRTVLAAALSVVAGYGAVAAEPQSQPAANESLPPGPHFIFTVPVALKNLPPEIDHYVVDCEVRVAFGNSTQRVGGGRTSVAIPGAGGTRSVDVANEVTVGVFVDGANVFPPTFATLRAVRSYACRLSLEATAFGRTTTYLVRADGASAPGQPTLPLAPGVPAVGSVSGELPP